MVFAVAWHKRTDAEMVQLHGTQSDQCVKPIRLVCSVCKQGLRGLEHPLAQSS